MPTLPPLISLPRCAVALPVSSFPNANSFAVTRKVPATVADYEDEEEKGAGNRPSGATNILEVQVSRVFFRVFRVRDGRGAASSMDAV